MDSVTVGVPLSIVSMAVLGGKAARFNDNVNARLLTTRLTTRQTAAESIAGLEGIHRAPLTGGGAHKKKNPAL